MHGISFSEVATGTGNGGFPNGPTGETMRRQLEAFLLAFPTNLAPIVGQQITLTATNSSVAGPRIDLLIQRANAGECDLVAKLEAYNQEIGYIHLGSGSFKSDRQAQAAVSDASLRSVATWYGVPVTYTCVPPGSGVRIGVDRDSDGYWDGDERDAGSNPANPNSTP